MDERQPEPEADEVEEMPALDYADPLKREDERELPGLDPTLTVPPE